MVKTVRKSEEFYATISSGKLVVCEWFAHWCLPCKSMAPVAEDLAAEFALTEFIKLDIDEAEELATTCGVTAVPTYQIFRSGVKVDEIVGADRSVLRDMILKQQ
eukprot:Colp12_sorted_trinity150504_noHs@26667